VVLDIASDNPDGGTIIVQGADFYWTPTVNALGDIAWMEYDHPDMGWTHTRIVVRTVSGQVEVVWDMAGVSAVWPQWDADGSLVFLADESGYWTFHRWRDGVVTRLHDHRFDFCEPPWVLSRPPYALLWDGAIGCTWWADSLAHVGKLLPDGSLVETLGCAAASVSPSGTVLVSGRERTISEESLDDTPRHSARSRRTHLTGVDPASCDCAQDGARRMANEVDEDQWLPARPMSVASLSWDDQSRALCVFDWEDGTYIPLVQEYEASNSVDNAHDILSSPENVEWKAETGEAVHGWFYPAVDLASTNSPAQDSPCDPHHAPDSPCEPQSAQDSLLEAHHRTPDSSCEPHSDQDFSPSPHPAPLLVLSHSGPTLQATSAFSLVIQYFTTHGIGVLDVNYSGSAGFGRAYRDRLNGTWGVVDVSDCVDGAEEMVRRGVADPDRLAIMGSSAGGFTTLAALTSSDIFKAGVSMYGIADLEAMTLDPVKLESHYNDWLIGPYPEQADLFRDRSPIHHLDKLNAPMLILQGEDDPVVAPSQAQAMYNAVLAKGLEAELVMYSGEGHGFRQPATIQDAYTRILEFLTRVFDLPT
jgi:dipeptidyl aminopeptidase/acylaminoacyl peptidase